MTKRKKEARVIIKMFKPPIRYLLLLAYFLSLIGPITQSVADESLMVVGKPLVVAPIVGAPAGPENVKPETNFQSNEPSSTSQPIVSADLILKDFTPPPRDPNLAQREPPHPHRDSTLAQAPPTIVTPQDYNAPPAPSRTPGSDVSAAAQPKEISSINFNNVAIIEYIRFMSRISNKNFIFNDEDLQFNVTIISEEATSIENLMAALLQELRIRDLSLIEQGNNLLIHRNPRVRTPARIMADGTEVDSSRASELVTRVFRLNTLDPFKASEIIRPLLSDDSLVEVLRDTNNLIITDIVSNVNKVAQLIATLDAPNSGITIGQYVVRNAFVDSLVDLATRILQPIAQGNPFVLVPHPSSNSVYVVSNGFIVEKALAILQHLDIHEGQTKILALENLQLRELPPAPPYPPGGRGPGEGPLNLELPPFPPAEGYPLGPLPPPEGFPPGVPPLQPAPPSFVPGAIGSEGQPIQVPPTFVPGVIGTEGRPSAIFPENREILPGGITTVPRWTRELPVGHIERTLFFIYKLRYRRGDQIEIALRKIADSLQLMGTANPDLVSAINSAQWIESSNAIIFTGTASALDRIRELILEIDIPLRQVAIEMLILETTISDSLTYGVDWVNRFGGGPTAGEQGFLGLSTFPQLLTAAEGVIPPFPQNLPMATGFVNPLGYAGGIIGTHLTHNGTRFSSIGALVRAIHSDSKTNVVMNPKIVAEDNTTAEIFVGSVDRYKTQSITQEFGDLVTNNFQFIDVGTTLRVTPLIGSNDIITLDIIQESTLEAPGANLSPENQLVFDVNLVQVLTKSRTVTKVHVPNGFFVVISGITQDDEVFVDNRIPCLGGIPILGIFGKRQDNTVMKHNLMLFIHPTIMETEADIEDITRRQQDLYREKSKWRRPWNYEIDQGLNFLNIKSTDLDEIGCTEQ
jgi:type III secretion protein C